MREQPERAEISVVVTTRDDLPGLRELLPALARQSRRPGEIVVVDGGSQDGSLQLLERWRERLPIRVDVKPGANISAGRNAGVRAARHHWIACTDAGCRPDPGWLAAIEAAGGRASFIAGTYVVEGQTALERALAVALYPSPRELTDPTLLVRCWQRLFGQRQEISNATGRSMAFTKDVWEAAGGFPEDLYAGEDVAFSSAAVATGCPATLAADAVVRWRPRPTWRSNARMYALYGRGLVRRRARRQVARLAAWVLAPCALLRGGRGPRLAVALGAGAYLYLPLRRLRQAGLGLDVLLRVPPALALKDLAQLAGAGAAVLDAAAGRPQPTPARTRGAR